jgi:hypothetical protein
VQQCLQDYELSYFTKDKTPVAEKDLLFGNPTGFGFTGLKANPYTAYGNITLKDEVSKVASDKV